LNRGLHDGTRVLTEEGFTRLTQRAIATDEPPDDVWYGYGIETLIVGGHTQIGHGGGMVGYFAGMIGDLDTGIGAVALVNGPGAPNLIAQTTLAFVNSLLGGTSFDFPDIGDSFEIESAADYAGAYVAVEGIDGPRRMQIVADGPSMTLMATGLATRLCSDEDDEFLTNAAELARFPLRFHREDGHIRHATHGDTLYLPADRPAPAPVDHPTEWDAFPGHYRSHNPWTPSIRVSLRQGRLWLSIAAVPDGLEAEQPLIPLEDGWFRAGDDHRIPERIKFDTAIDGKAHRALLSGCDFYRVNVA